MIDEQDARERTRAFLDRIGAQYGSTPVEPQKVTLRYAFNSILRDVGRWWRNLVIDLGAIGLVLVLIGLLMAGAFDVTSTFPISVKWAFGAVVTMIVGLMLFTYPRWSRFL